jgi:hypothetical protein
MKKLSLLLALIWVSCYPIIGQAVTTDPLLPTGDKEVTLIFDLKQSKDSRTKGLLGKPPMYIFGLVLGLLLQAMPLSTFRRGRVTLPNRLPTEK